MPRYALRQVDRCPAKLARGEYKRVPLKGPIIGIFLACPACGYHCITAVSGDDAGERGIVEDDSGALNVEKPVTCLICAKPARISNGELTVDGD